MNTKEILLTAQIVISVLLIVSILLQQKGSGLGNVFGGGGGGGEAFRSKRGFDKLLFNTTVLMAVLFTINSLAIFYLNGK